MDAGALPVDGEGVVIGHGARAAGEHHGGGGGDGGVSGRHHDYWLGHC